jgi:hypothetical protein
MAPSHVCLFALEASAELGRAIAAALGQQLASHEERDFEDGEHKSRPLDDVSGADVYVVQSLHSGPQQSANDKLCRLLFFIGALKDAGAARVTAVSPYLCYARKDRRTKPNDPVTTRYVASLFEAVGTDGVVTLEVHNPAAFENAFRCRTVTLRSADQAGHADCKQGFAANFVGAASAADMARKARSTRRPSRSLPRSPRAACTSASVPSAILGPPNIDRILLGTKVDYLYTAGHSFTVYHLTTRSITTTAPILLRRLFFSFDSGRRV